MEYPIEWQFEEPTEAELELYRARLRNMTDTRLLEEGQGNAALAQQTDTYPFKPRPVWGAHLRECRTEWQRRQAARRESA